MNPIDTLPDRILEKFEVRGPDECWPWHASKKPEGYGRIWDGRQGHRTMRHAHRVIYELLGGEIPDGWVLDHICKNPNCVNPTHMRPLTHAENCLLSDTSPFATNARKTHCKRGHPLTGDNVWHHRGERWCRECMRFRCRENKRRQQERANG